MFTLESCDGKTFQAPFEALKQSIMLHGYMETIPDATYLKIDAVHAKNMEKIVRYMRQHVDEERDHNELDALFFNLTHEELFDLLGAVDYMQVQGMVDGISQKIADDIKDKSSEEIREMFNIEDDLTPEEKEQIRKENEWFVEN